jgi:hypothetical protein
MKQLAMMHLFLLSLWTRAVMSNDTIAGGKYGPEGV